VNQSKIATLHLKEVKTIRIGYLTDIVIIEMLFQW